MNILHINQDISTKGGGVATFIRDSARSMNEFGHRVSVVTGEKDAPRMSFIHSQEFVPEVTRPTADVGNGSWRERLDDTIHRERIDVAHISEVQNLAIVSHVAERIPTVLHLHNYGMFCPGNDLYLASDDVACDRVVGWKCLVCAYTKRCNNRHPVRLFRSVLNTLKRRQLFQLPSVRFVVGSEFLREKAIAAGAPADRTEVVLYAADKDRLVSEGTSRPAGIPDDYVLFVGRLAKSKGVSYLLEAIRGVKNSNTKLVVVGDGVDRRAIELEIEKWQLQDRVVLTGWKSGVELTWLFRNCRLLVVPSVWPEVFGIVGLEAMAAGKPVVASSVGGIPEWLSDNESGFLVPPANASAITTAISRILENQELAANMGEASLKRYNDEFTTETQAERLLKLYKVTISGRLQRAAA